MRDTHILRAFYDAPWAILPERLMAIESILLRHASGGRADGEVLTAIRAHRAERAAAQNQRQDEARRRGVALISVMGIIEQRASAFDMSGPGGTATQAIAGNLRAALNDPEVSAVLLEVDSPGGSVYGVDELAAEIFEARGQKPIEAAINSLGASAAFYLASAAEKISLTPGGEVGSVGVIAMHVDLSEHDKMQGANVTLITAGKFKGELSDTQPLTDEALSYVQGRVNDYYDAFVRAVAKGRGTSMKDVRENYGEGRVFGAEQALKVGMVDRVETFEATLNRLAKRASRRPSARSIAVKQQRALLGIAAASPNRG